MRRDPMVRRVSATITDNIPGPGEPRVGFSSRREENDLEVAGRSQNNKEYTEIGHGNRYDSWPKHSRNFVLHCFHRLWHLLPQMPRLGLPRGVN